MTFKVSSARYYRDQAKRIRALAEESIFPETKEQLLTVAAQFDQLGEELSRPAARPTRGDAPFR
jgi:hypothetical protein